MPYKDKEKQREYQKGWYQRKKAGLPTKTKNKLTDEQLSSNRRIYQKKWREKQRVEAEKLLGNSCLFCQRERRLRYHKKDGKEHDISCTARLVVKNPDKYVRLCEYCHKAVHWCMEYFNMTWEEIVERLKYYGVI